MLGKIEATMWWGYLVVALLLSLAIKSLKTLLMTMSLTPSTNSLG